MDIVSWSKAKKSGLKRYFTGTPCWQGHIAPRYIGSGACIVCQALQEEVRRPSKGLRLKKSKILLGDYSQSPAESLGRNASDAAYRLKNKDRRSEQGRAWYAKNIELNRRKKREYYAKNPNAYRRDSAHRRALMASADGGHSKEEISILFNRQRGKCGSCLCRLRADFHVDHKIPLSLGGSNGMENIEILCRPCNLKKGKLDPIKWANRNGRLL